MHGKEIATGPLKTGMTGFALLPSPWRSAGVLDTPMPFPYC